MILKIHEMKGNLFQFYRHDPSEEKEYPDGRHIADVHFYGGFNPGTWCAHVNVQTERVKFSVYISDGDCPNPSGSAAKSLYSDIMKEMI